MKKSRHFTFAAISFGISSAGFLFTHYLLLGGGLGLMAATYAGLAFHAHGQERRR